MICVADGRRWSYTMILNGSLWTSIFYFVLIKRSESGLVKGMLVTALSSEQQEGCSFNTATQLLETPQTVGEFCNFSIFTPRMRLPICLLVETVIMRPPSGLPYRSPVTVDIKFNHVESDHS